MANRKLTKKEKGFVTDYGGLGTGSKTVKKHYEVSTDEVARAIAHENLTKPHIQEALDDRGFNEGNAKNVVVEIMEDKEEDANARLKATDQVFKVVGSYAPEKSQALNVNVGLKISDPKLQKLNDEYNEKVFEMLKDESPQ